VVLAGVRDLEDYQRRRLEQADASTVPGAIDAECLEATIARLNERASRVYLRVDLDSLDLEEARANKYAAPGGPSLTHLLACIRLVPARFDLAAAISAYDPALDPDDRTIGAARSTARELARGIRLDPTSRTG
jgi:arginase family enzyme